MQKAANFSGKTIQKSRVCHGGTPYSFFTNGHLLLHRYLVDTCLVASAFEVGSEELLHDG